MVTQDDNPRTVFQVEQAQVENESGMVDPLSDLMG
jgi:hypothetical protein